MLNAIPFLGWGMSLFFSTSLAIPFWFIWTVCGVGATYFYFLPPVWQTPGFWACVGIFIVTSIIKGVFLPRLISVNNTSSKKD